jgi:Domain of unknown function (DUF3291)
VRPRSPARQQRYRVPVDAPTHHLAQVNIARLHAPLTSPVLAEFIAALEPINALADGSPGFVWRLQTEDGDATSIQAFDDDRIIVNMSVWASVETLSDFVYRSRHADVMRRRREWFEQMSDTFVVLWWISAGHVPSVDEAKERLASLENNGPGPDAFTFRVPFAAPGSAVVARPRVGDRGGV